MNANNTDHLEFPRDNTPEAGSLVTTHDVIGGTAVMTEVEPKPALIPEISAERKDTFEPFDPTAKYLVGCSDDRKPTDESQQLIVDQYGVEPDNYIRIYGGLHGGARRALVAIAAYYGPEVLAQYDGKAGIGGFTGEYKKRVETAVNVVLGDHSAEGNEGNASALDLESEKGLGCAYCEGICAVTSLCADRQGLALLAEDEVPTSLGEPARMDIITEANRAVGEQFLADGQPVTRHDMIDLNAPVAIYAGAHAPAEEVKVVLNFTDNVSSPNKAIATEVPFYCVDVMHELRLAKNAFPELFNNEQILETLAHVIEHDARAVRQALASHEGKTAEDMQLERYGDLQSAIAYVLAA